MRVQGERCLLLVRQPRDRVEAPGVHLQATVALEVGAQHSELDVLSRLPVPHRALVELPRLPGGEPDLLQVGEAGRVAGCEERLLDGNSDCGVVAMAVGGVSAPARDHELGLHEPNRANELADETLLAPLLKRLGAALAEVVVEERAEQRFGAVDLARSERFPGAVDAQLDSGVRRDAALAAFPAGGRPVQGPDAVVVREQGEKPVLLVVRMRADVEDVPRLRKAPEQVDERSDPALGFRHGRSPSLRTRRSQPSR